MQIIEFEVPDVRILIPERIGDSRGYFCETWNRDRLRNAGIDIDFVQDNQSLSGAKGTLRGLHFQIPPEPQAKLVRVVRGRVYDVAVDIRKGSPAFGRHVGVELSAEEGNQLLVPEGFAHGFMTLEPDTEVLYKVSNYFSSEHDRGLLWSDPDFAIDWPDTGNAPMLSDKDKDWPPLSQFDSPFSFARRSAE